MNETTDSKQFLRAQRAVAGGVFIVALITYLLTIEPTASFWDCPEYVAQAAGMEVGHPPGNPTWLLAARMAAILSPSPEKTALFVNATSALFTALAAMLLALTASGLTARLTRRRDAALTAGAVAGLIFAWCDTAWFSAVEAEVYAFSIFCTALCVRIAERYAEARGAPRRARLLILLAYVTGLSIGVHQLNLLCLPACAMLMASGGDDAQAPRRTRLWRHYLKPLLLGAAAIVMILFGVMPGCVETACQAELIAVNGLGLPFQSGLLAYVALLVLSLAAAIWALRQGAPAILAATLLFLALFLSGLFSLGGRLPLGAAGALICAVALIWRPAAVRRRAYLSLWCVSMMLLGFSVFGIIILRAAANPPMNEGSPADIFSFASYLGREQYGSRPLLRGRTPQSAMLRREVMTTDSSGHRRASYPDIVRLRGKAEYAPAIPGGLLHPRSRMLTGADSSFNADALARLADGGDAYLLTDYSYDYAYPPELDMWFPRIVSNKPSHLEAYDSWVGMRESTMVAEKVSYAIDSAGHAAGRFDNTTGERVRSTARRPSYAQNLEILASYQIGYMYLRYLLWNFSGRQNEVPSQGQVESGNFITGFPVIDRLMLGDDSLLPPAEGTERRGRNVYFLLPLLLGLGGMIWQASRGRRGARQFWALLTLFAATGLAIVIYLNQTPGEARERDYSFIGSFWTYALWCGMGAAALMSLAGRRRALRLAAAAACLGVAGWVCFQNADDHDRSGRTATTDFARATLLPVEKEGLIFVNGDNYTFPLWYAQETEGYRTDVRVINLAYLSTPWYAAQLAIPSREAPSVPMTATPEQLAYGAFAVVNIPADGPCADALETLRALYASARADATPRLATRRVRIPTAGADSITIDLRDAAGTSYLTLSKLLMLDIIATNASLPRPRAVRWSAALPPSHTLGLARYGASDGLTVLLTPERADGAPADARRTARQMLEDYRYGGFPQGVMPDEPGEQQIRLLRRAIRKTASRLLDEGDARTALRLVRLQLDSLPPSAAPMSVYNDRFLVRDEAVETATLLCRAADSLGRPALRAEALDLLLRQTEDLGRWRRYYDSLPPRLRAVVSSDVTLRIASLYAPADAYLRLGGDSARLAATKVLHGIDMKKAAAAWRRSEALQQLRHLGLTPGNDTARAECARRYLEWGGDSATLMKYYK